MTNPLETSFFAAPYTTHFSDTLSDTEWDQFIFDTPDGHYTQTALWSEVKAVQGWRPLRLILKDGQGVVGGAQILTRNLPLGGKMGYISKGPLCRAGAGNLCGALLREILILCKKEHVLYLSIQPPDHGYDLQPLLDSAAMIKSSQGDLEKPATVLIDLCPDEDQILKSIKPNKRKHIRSALKQDFHFYEGGREDLPTFFRLHNTTGKKKDFEVQSQQFFEKLWDVFSPHGYVHLFIEELAGEPLIAKIAITYKDTFYSFRIGWNGEHCHQYPNEAVTWHAILWAREHGFCTYDLGGISTQAAQKVVNGEGIPDELHDTYTEYKLHYSNHVVIYPETYEMILNPFLFSTYQMIAARPALQEVIKKVYRLSRNR